MKVLKFAAAALLVSAPVFAQDDSARRQATEVAARVPLEKAMKGAPYSAETIVESSQTLADGNRINRKTTGQVYRDSEGRTRREEEVQVRTFTGNGFVPGTRKAISIVDPVAGFSYSLDTDKKIAWRTALGGINVLTNKIEMLNGVRTVSPERTAAVEGAEKRVIEEKVAAAQPTQSAGGGGRGGAAGGFATTTNPTAVARGGGDRAMVQAAGGGGGRGGRIGGAASLGPLEHKTIEGVAVEGRKTTTVIPAGQVGNDQPITITSEEWRSPDLNLLVLTKHSDPRTGESSYRLQNIIRAEPDRSLFIVPSDYEVKDTGIRRNLESAQRK